jgi:cell division protein FtsB
VSVWRLVGIGFLLAGATFALMGGEYSTLDWWNLHRSIRAEQEAIETLTREADSLRVWADALENDPATQEKVAREAFGMLRPGEILYRVERRQP